MCDLDHWCQTLETSQVGLTILSNLWFDWDKQRISRECLCSILDNVRSRWAEESVRDIDSAVKIFLSSIDNDQYCSGPGVVKFDNCSRVMDIRSLIHDDTERNGRKYGCLDLNQAAISLESFSPKSVVHRLEKSGVSGLVKEASTIGGRYGFAWVTQQSSLSIISSLSEQAKTSKGSFVRDSLGLIDVSKTTYLIEVRYPARVPDQDNLFTPTSLEGGNNRVFRSVETSDGWGRTVNLQTYQNDQPEAVHRTIAFSEEFKIADVGEVTTPPPNFDSSAHQRFFEHFDSKWEHDFFHVINDQCTCGLQKINTGVEQ
jgi:hypothetical protein